MGRKIILVLVGLFLIFYVIAEPRAAADATQNLFTILGVVFRALVVFFTRLAGN